VRSPCSELCSLMEPHVLSMMWAVSPICRASTMCIPLLHRALAPVNPQPGAESVVFARFMPLRRSTQACHPLFESSCLQLIGMLAPRRPASRLATRRWLTPAPPCNTPSILTSCWATRCWMLCPPSWAAERCPPAVAQQQQQQQEEEEQREQFRAVQDLALWVTAVVVVAAAATRRLARSHTAVGRRLKTQRVSWASR
jgi:hypothetical protein